MTLNKKHYSLYVRMYVGTTRINLEAVVISSLAPRLMTLNEKTLLTADDLTPRAQYVARRHCHPCNSSLSVLLHTTIGPFSEYFDSL